MGGYEPIKTWKDYVTQKTDKLQHQFDALEKSNDDGVKHLFAGVSVWVNGLTVPSSSEIKKLMAEHGGLYQHYYSKRGVTHIIATMLPDSKINDITDEKVVRPQWIVDCISQRKVLPVFEYLLYPPSPGNTKSTTQTSPSSGSNSGNSPFGFSSSQLADKCPPSAQKSPTFSTPEIATKQVPIIPPPTPVSSSASRLSFTSKYASNPAYANPPNILQAPTSTHPTNTSHKHAYNNSPHHSTPNNFKQPYPPSQSNYHAPPNEVAPTFNTTTSTSTTASTPSGSPDTSSVSSSPSTPTKPKFLTTRSKMANAAKSDSQNVQKPPPTPVTTATQPSKPFNAASPITTVQTAADEGFVENYFHKSRLAHLSNWRQTFQDEITAFLLAVSSPPKGPVDEIDADSQGSMTFTFDEGSQVEPDSGPRVVMHVDMDCFFASVGIRSRPHLIGTPVIVAHSNSSTSSTSSVASSNYTARKYGIKNGSLVGKAKQLCPEVVVLPYEFDKYERVSKQMYQVFLKYTKRIQVGSCDEALLELTGENKTKPLEVALAIRKEIYDTTGCTASVGIGENILLARLACRKAKPDGQCILQAREVLEVLAPQDVDVLPGLGWKTSRKLADYGIITCKDLYEKSLEWLQKEFGQKSGKNLYNYCRGFDDRPLKLFQLRKSHGVDVSWGVRFTSDAQAYKFINNLATELAQRLESRNVSGRMVVFKLKKRRDGAPIETHKFLGHGIVDEMSRSVTLDKYVRDAPTIYKECVKLYETLKVPALDVRGIGIHLQKLDNEKEDDAEPQVKKETGNESLLSFFKRTDTTTDSTTTSTTPTSNNNKTATPSINTSPNTKINGIMKNSNNNFNGDEPKKPAKRIKFADNPLYAEPPAPLPLFHTPPTMDDSFIFDDVEEDYQSHTIRADYETSDNEDPNDEIVPDTFSTLPPDTSDTKPHVSTTVIPSNHVDGYILPSASQLDTSVLKHLPADLRKTIENAYHSNKHERYETEEKPIKVKREKKSEQKSVDKMFTWKQLKLEKQEIGVDPEFLAALPDDIRKEIEAQLASKKPSPLPSTKHALSRTHAASPPLSRSPSRTPAPLTPSKSRTLREILTGRRMADSWRDFSAFLTSNGPSPSHFSVLEAQVVQWVDADNLEDVSFLLSRLKKIATHQAEWAPMFNELLQVANKKLIEIYATATLHIQPLLF